MAVLVLSLDSLVWLRVWQSVVSRLVSFWSERIGVLIGDRSRLALLPSLLCPRALSCEFKHKQPHLATSKTRNHIPGANSTQFARACV
eukprot:1141794-Rhodomonas_salina.1